MNFCGFRDLLLVELLDFAGLRFESLIACGHCRRGYSDAEEQEYGSDDRVKKLHYNLQTTSVSRLSGGTAHGRAPVTGGTLRSFDAILWTAVSASLLFREELFDYLLDNL